MSPWYLPVVVSGQMPVTSPIAHRPSPARSCASTEMPLRVGVDADRLEPDALDPRATTGRDEQSVAAERPSIVELEDEVVAVASCGRPRCTPSTSSMPSRRSTSPRASPSGAGSLASTLCGDVDEHDLAAEAAHRLRHLDADRTAAQDDEPAGHLGHRGDLAVGPHALELAEPGDRRDERRRAVGHDDVPCRVSHAVDLDGARVRRGGRCRGSGRCRDRRAMPRRWCRCASTPCSRAMRTSPSTSTSRVRRGLVRVVGRLARPEQRLRRDARPVGALAADELALDDGDSEPTLGERAGTVLAGRAGAEDDDVVVAQDGSSLAELLREHVRGVPLGPLRRRPRRFASRARRARPRRDRALVGARRRS